MSERGRRGRPTDGVVEDAGPASGFGLWVVLKHLDKINPLPWLAEHGIETL